MSNTGHMNNGQESLLIGIGNCGRNDDGLGWAFLDRVKEHFDGQVEYRYQLQVEDAALISRAASVIFVDSYRGELHDGFDWRPCEPSPAIEFTSHVLAPTAVMQLSRDLFNALPQARLLLIEGSSWDLHNGLTTQAEAHLEMALQFFEKKYAPRHPRRPAAESRLHH